MNKTNLTQLTGKTMPESECLVVLHCRMAKHGEKITYQELFKWTPIDKNQYPYNGLRESENDLVGILVEVICNRTIKIYKDDDMNAVEDDKTFYQYLGYERVQDGSVMMDVEMLSKLSVFKSFEALEQGIDTGTRDYILELANGEKYLYTLYGKDGRGNYIILKRKIVEVERLFTMPSGLSIFASDNGVGGQIYYGESSGIVGPIFNTALANQEEILTALMLAYGINYVQSIDPISCELRDGDKCELVNMPPEIELFQSVREIIVKKDIFGRITARGFGDVILWRSNCKLIERDGVKLINDPRISYEEPDDFLMD